MSMNIYRSIETVPFHPRTYLTLGTYDGVHIGHQEIIQRLAEDAQKNQGRSLLVTFFPHPQMVIRGEHQFDEILTPMDEKIELLEAAGLDSLLIITFDAEFQRMEPADFVKNQLVASIGLSRIFMGFNHAFGKARKGDIDLLNRLKTSLGYEVEEVGPVRVEGDVVSSTLIRQCIRNGEVEKASRLLSRPYQLTGIVSHGQKIGTRLGFPTANLTVQPDFKLIPGDGVYVVLVHFDDQICGGIVNIGLRPSIPKAHGRQIEVHVNDFSGDLYDKPMTIQFVNKLRDELQFDSLSDLTKQIKKDQTRSKDILSKFL